MIPLRLMPELFPLDGGATPPEARAQRQLNRGRLPRIAQYVVEARDRYIFPAITASIDGEPRFETIAGSDPTQGRIGLLYVPATARLVVNDGQHRRAAIDLLLKQDPSIADECIGVVFYLDVGLERSQQRFADLNGHGVRSTRSISILYDQKDPLARTTRAVVQRSDLLRELVDLERSTLSPRSRRLLTLSSLYLATGAVFRGRDVRPVDDVAQVAASYWHEVARHLPEWQAVREKRMTAGEVRLTYLHPHGVALQALGEVGRVLLLNEDTWVSRLRRLRTLDWRRSNSSLWEGRAMVGGRISKAGSHVILTGNAIKQHLGIELKPEEQRVEDAFLRGRRG